MISRDEIEKTIKVERNPKGPYTTELGVVLKYRKVSSDMVRRAWTAIPVPKPPEVWIEDHGRFEPNPADPGYNNEIAVYNNKVTMVIHTIYMMRGVDVFSCPDDVPGPESTEWHEGLEAYMDVPQGKLARKAAWLLDYVLDDNEREEIISDLMKLSGLVTEDKVDEALNSFRSNGISEADKSIQDNE